MSEWLKQRAGDLFLRVRDAIPSREITAGRQSPRRLPEAPIPKHLERIIVTEEMTRYGVFPIEFSWLTEAQGQYPITVQRHWLEPLARMRRVDPDGVRLVRATAAHQRYLALELEEPVDINGKQVSVIPVLDLEMESRDTLPALGVLLRLGVVSEGEYFSQDMRQLFPDIWEIAIPEVPLQGT